MFRGMQGAASLTSLLSVSIYILFLLPLGVCQAFTLCSQSIAPKVLMVEEAGQVLEAHILTSLVSDGKPPVLSDIYNES